MTCELKLTTADWHDVMERLKKIDPCLFEVLDRRLLRIDCSVEPLTLTFHELLIVSAVVYSLRDDK